MAVNGPAPFTPFKPFNRCAPFKPLFTGGFNRLNTATSIE